MKGRGGHCHAGPALRAPGANSVGAPECEHGCRGGARQAIFKMLASLNASGYNLSDVLFHVG